MTPDAHWLGRTLDGRYRIERVLGAGGMGTVYLATDVRIDRPVVVKVPHARLLVEEGFRERFDREVRSLIRLSHRGIVKVLDVGSASETDGAPATVPFAVLEYLAGGSLADRLEKSGGSQSVAEVLAWLPLVAEALDFIHRQHVVHRDVKPGNVLFDPEGHVYLADFGIAKALGATTDTGLTRTGTTPGSPAYMGPEVAMGLPIGPAYDEYALGVVVYEALSGALPHEGSSAEVLVAKKAYVEPMDLRTKVPHVPEAACAAVMHALARKPEDRFPTCRAFADALAAGLAATARADSTAALPRPPPVLTRAETAFAATPAAPQPSRPPVLRLVIAAALLAVGVTLFALLFSSKAADDGSRVRTGGGTGGEPASMESPAPAAPPISRIDTPPPASSETPASPRALPRAAEPPPAASPTRKLSPAEEAVAAFLAGWAKPVGEEIDAATGYPKRIVRTADDAEMVLIPSGSFAMGGENDDLGRRDDEIPRHAVTITNAYYLDVTEVTIGQFRRFCTQKQRTTPNWSLDRSVDDAPAYRVTYEEAEAFCRWARVELPTEAEWERAAKGGHDDYRYPWGRDDDVKRRNGGGDEDSAADGHRGLAPVRSYAPNDYGLYDLAGNVWEMCADWYGAEYYKTSPPTDPKGPDGGEDRVTRGSAWNSFAEGGPYDFRVASRGVIRPGDRLESTGFRCARRLPVASAGTPEAAAADQNAVLIVDPPPEGWEGVLLPLHLRGSFASKRASDRVFVEDEQTVRLVTVEKGRFEVVVDGMTGEVRRLTVSVKDGEATRASQEVTFRFGGRREPERVVVEHVLFGIKGTAVPHPSYETAAAASAGAARVLKLLLASAMSWAEAKDRSDDPSKAEIKLVNRGVAKQDGEVDRDAVVAAFGDTAFELAVGEIKLVPYDEKTSPFGFEIVKRVR